MVVIDGTKITMTRGDTLRTRVIILRRDDGNEYTPEQNDVIEFALKSPGMKPGNTDFRDRELLQNRLNQKSGNHHFRVFMVIQRNNAYPDNISFKQVCITGGV